MTAGGTTHECELGCGRPVKGASLCRECTLAWADGIRQVADLAADLALVLSRQTRYSTPAGGGRSAEAPVPFDARVARVAVDARATMRRVAAAAGMPGAGGASTSGVCSWLRGRVWDLGKAPDAADMAEATQVVLDRLRWVCDRPAERDYLGRCPGPRVKLPPSPPSDCQCACHAGGAVWRPACDVPGGCGHLHAPSDPAVPPSSAGACGEDLYVRPDAERATCWKCGTEVDVASQREYLLVVLHDHLASATELARLLSRYGEPVKAERVRKWHARGLLERRGVDRRGDPTYRVGDVLARLEAENVRAEKTKARARA